MKKLLLLLFISSLSFAQNANRKHLSHSWQNDVLEIITTDGKYIIKPYSSKIVETSFIPTNETFNPVSHAVVLIPIKTNYQLIETTDIISLYSDGMVISINKSPFQISYFYKNNQLILSEKNGYTKVNDSTQTIDFNISSDEKLYGGGARVLGMDRRGNKLQLYNRAHYGYEKKAELMNFCIPLVLSSKMYAVHFDNPAIGYLDLDSKKDNTLSYETISGRKTYQVIIGDSWNDLIYNYTNLTGKQPLLPRWALGNFSSRFGYHTQEEVEKTIQKFQDDKIPVDAIILDLYWFGKDIKGTMGNLEWDKDNFPNPEKMIANLNEKGVKTILITEPFILTTSSKWQEAVDKKVLAITTDGKPATWDFYFGNTGIVDVFKPEGKAWFWDIYKSLINQGVGGLWGDLGEPEVFPSSVQTFAGKADVVHNIYGHNWAKLIADGYKKDFPMQRPFILMRAGYSGSQRFGMIPWSGDVNRTWGGFSHQTEIALQMGMQGMGFMHSDLGGFAGANLDDELYTRWLQYGVFNPIFRPHAQEEVASEPVYRSDKVKELAKCSIELRYQMLPYNYTLAYQNSITGKPLMQPLFFEEPENEMLQTKSDEYFWGNDFLIAPIVEKGQTQKEIYFPKSSNWFDYYTGKKYNAGSTETIAVVENHIPTFVRGNVFYPTTKLVQSLSKYENSNLDLHLYLDTKTSSEREFYFDDGITPNANNDYSKHELLNCATEFDKKGMYIKLESKSSSKEFALAGKFGTIFIYNVDSKPKCIESNKKKLKFTYDKKTKMLQFDYMHSDYKTEFKVLTK